MALGDWAYRREPHMFAADAETPCEPRPRAVPEVGSPELGAPRPLVAPAVTPSGVAVDLPSEDQSRDWLLLWVGGELVWSRGFDYESLGEGHYEDDQL